MWPSLPLEGVPLSLIPALLLLTFASLKSDFQQAQISSYLMPVCWSPVLLFDLNGILPSPTSTIQYLAAA